jgi:thymidylate synthase (FAD)
MEVQLLEATENPEHVICSAARNDYLEEWVGNMTFEERMDAIDGDNIEDKKQTLIEHLLQRGHFGPFEHVNATFAVKGISRSLMAQITRHRHATFDIQSMRYVSFEDAEPEPGEAVVSIPEFDTVHPAGRNADMDDEYQEKMDEEEILNTRKALYEEAIGTSFRGYKELLKLGVAPENARMVLPIGTKVNMVFSVNARMLMHIGDMRASGEAQWEIRQMTEEILELAEDWCPNTFSYYNEEMKNRKNRLAP